MKVMCWLIILAGIALACESQDSHRPQENDLAVSGQLAQVCDYSPDFNYDPALNPLYNQTDGYGRAFKDFCLWLTIANNGRHSLVFDAIKAVWFFDGNYFTSRLAINKGKGIVIPPGGQRQFSFSTISYKKTKAFFGSKQICFCCTLTAFKNQQQDFGPFVSDNFAQLITLLVCDKQEIGSNIADNKYYPLKFFLVRDDFVSDNLKKLKKFQ